MYNSIEKGHKYSDLTKTVVILFIDYIDNLIDNIPKIDTSWHIREDTYSQIILTDFFEFHIISLRKLEEIANNQTLDDIHKKSLISWLKFLRNPKQLEEKDMEDNKEIQEAKDEFEKIQQDAKERELARLRERYIWDMNSAEDKGVRKVARNMKNENFDIAIIQKMTGLTKEEIERL